MKLINRGLQNGRELCHICLYWEFTHPLKLFSLTNAKKFFDKLSYCDWNDVSVTFQPHFVMVPFRIFFGKATRENISFVTSL